MAVKALECKDDVYISDFRGGMTNIHRVGGEIALNRDLYLPFSICPRLAVLNYNEMLG